MALPGEPVSERDRWRTLAVRYLLAQSLGAIVWWALMIARPEWRPYFIPDGRPDILWSFLPGDLLLFIGAGLAAATGLERKSSIGWPALLLHVGGAFYASAYTIALWAYTGKAFLGAILMVPSLVVPPFLAWRLRP